MALWGQSALLLACLWLAQGIESPCSACKATARELQSRLDREKQRSLIDMRGRLDSEGKRYGKTLDWRVSEQRFEELLEGLCKFADHYRLANDSWVDTRQSAAGSLPEVPRAQRQAEQRALLSHCSLLIEQHEDDLVAGLQRKSAPPVQQLLCQELSRACRPATSAETEL